jgi:hypothetical protein
MQDIHQEAKQVGFYFMPPTIDEFIQYIGFNDVVYDFWKSHLRAIYPDNIHVSHNYQLFTGAIGTGKSTMSKIMALYNLAKLLCLYDLSKFKIAITKAIQFVFFHVKMEKARNEFVEFLEYTVHTNSFFKQLIKQRQKAGLPDIPVSFVTDGTRSNNAIGGDVIFYVFSEVNFVKEQMITYKIDQAYKRFKSRFLMAMPYLGNIIIDTSSSFEGSSVSELLTGKDDFYIVRASQWEAKPFQYFKKGHFYVYTGGPEGPPSIVQDDMIEHYPQDKIIKVPKELEREFKTDIYEALISLAGINVRAPNTLFQIGVVEKCMNIEPKTPDIIHIYDLIGFIEPILSIMPLDRIYYIHVDTSIRGDNTGIAISYFDSDDKVKIPFAAAIHNNKDDIPMFIIEEFIIQMSKKRYFDMITADAYQSYKLLQDLSRKTKIKTKVFSVDSSPAVYLNLKKGIIDQTICIVKNDILRRELESLLIITKNSNIKIDHPMDGSKDVSDAVASVHYMALEEGKKKKIFHEIKTEENYDIAQKAIAKNMQIRMMGYNPSLQRYLMYKLNEEK